MSRQRRRPKTEQLAPALFPFLAVLLCTMGALVLVLVLVVSQASASAKQTLQVQQDKLLEVSDIVEVASEELQARREIHQKAMEARRSQLSAIEDHIDRLIDELKQLEKVAEAIDKQTQGSEQKLSQRDEQIADLEKKIADEQRELERLRAEMAKKPPAFAILPYQGTNGTTRRPIYLECTQRGVIIQPEGILLTLEDLKPPHGPGNPLDSSLRLIRTAFQRAEPSAASQVSPYPLLLVRPDGIKAYVLARAAMSGWDDQFGYELIDQTMPLAFPPSVPGLSPHLVDTIEVSRQRQAALIAAMPRRYASDDWSDALESISADPDEGRSNLSGSRSALASNDWATLDQTPSSQTMGPEWKMVQEMDQKAAGGQLYSPLTPPSGSMPGVGATQTSPATTMTDAKLAAQSTTPWQSGPGGMQPSANQQQSASAPRTTTENQEPAMHAGGQAATPQAMASLPMAENGNNTTTRAGDLTPTLSDPNAMSPSNSPLDRRVVTEREANTSGNSPSTEWNNNQESRSSKSSKERELTTAANSRSWTSRRRITNGTAISRPMTLVVMPDRWFVMRDDRPDLVEQVIPLQAGPLVAKKKLDEAIEARIESWGVALAGGYWQPKLNIQLAPHAELSAQRLQKILEESGLETEFQPLP